MKGNKLETLDEMYEPTLLERYLNQELYYIKSCGTDEKIKSRIFEILNLGTQLK